MNCPICSADIPAPEGRGRPQVYCGETCRCTAEFAVRRLARRLDATEIELREALAGFTRFGVAFRDERERAERVRALRYWVAQDDARLRALLGGPTKTPADARGPDAVSPRSDTDPAGCR